MTDEQELISAWVKAQGEVAEAKQAERGAAHAATAAYNQLSEAKRVEAAAWKALEAYRAKVAGVRS